MFVVGAGNFKVMHFFKRQNPGIEVDGAIQVRHCHPDRIQLGDCGTGTRHQDQRQKYAAQHYCILAIRCSPTRRALAMIVKPGLTAALDGKKLPSTTYRLSTSWALQLRSRADFLGSVPKRIVPFWCATPASGMR